MYVTSPGGYQYPRPLAWDASATDMELALEWTYDLADVAVSYTRDSNNTRSYKVTFEVPDLWILDRRTHQTTYGTFHAECAPQQHPRSSRALWRVAPFFLSISRSPTADYAPHNFSQPN